MLYNKPVQRVSGGRELGLETSTWSARALRVGPWWPTASLPLLSFIPQRPGMTPKTLRTVMFDSSDSKTHVSVFNFRVSLGIFRIFVSQLCRLFSSRPLFRLNRRSMPLSLRHAFWHTLLPCTQKMVQPQRDHLTQGQPSSQFSTRSTRPPI